MWQRLRTTVASCVVICSFLVLGAISVEARSLSYPEYQVDIEVNRNSTVDVTETITNTFEGEYRGALRKITLSDPQLSERCIQTGQTCGGFEYLDLLAVYDNEGNKLPANSYEAGIETEEDSGKRYFTIRWEVWPGGKVHDGTEEFTWQIKYRLYGSLGNLATEEGSWLYWNALPEDRGGTVEKAEINIQAPEGYQLDPERLEVYTAGYDYDTQLVGDELTIRSENLSSFGAFTVAYQFPQDIITLPATLKYSATLPQDDVETTINAVSFGEADGEIKGIPAGETKIIFSRNGYQPRAYDLDLAAGETVELDANLQPTAFTNLLLILNTLMFLLGIVLALLAPIAVYFFWRNNGRDRQMPRTIIPLFQPPQGIRPYLLGSLKDETVDQEDIVGTIIDLAYRGYLKIKELEGKDNYKLLKQEKNTAELTQVEKDILDAIFGEAAERDLQDVGERFASRYYSLQKDIYAEMVDKNYFKRSPEQVRAQYYGIGVAAFIFGVFLAIALGIFTLALIGVVGAFSLGLALAILGLSFLVAARYLPAKTVQGSKTLAEILGFKMYLETAERYRLQDLGPEEFERFLAYAVVFGIEQDWAKKFEGIYEGKPDWLETESTDVLWNAYLISVFSRSFSDSVNSTFTAAQMQAASGSGWSGGGSFGGFAGGGGGGGVSGGF